MSTNPTPALSVADMFAQREAQRRREKEAEEQLTRKQQEELSAFKKRLDEFQVTESQVQSVLARIKRAFDKDENELMLTSFPSSFCSDSGRAITNAGRAPIVKSGPDGAAAEREPEWLATLPAGARQVYDYWRANLKPGGFSFTARIINYPGGMPGDVGLFFSWPKSAMEAQG
jgi:hypothetical protein